MNYLFSPPQGGKWEKGEGRKKYCYVCYVSNNINILVVTIGKKKKKTIKTGYNPKIDYLFSPPPGGRWEKGEARNKYLIPMFKN